VIREAGTQRLKRRVGPVGAQLQASQEVVTVVALAAASAGVRDLARRVLHAGAGCGARAGWPKGCHGYRKVRSSIDGRGLAGWLTMIGLPGQDRRGPGPLCEVTLLTMAEITVRILGESDWPLYREVRLRALAQSPSAFTATLADEEDRGESFWRDRMTRSYRLLAERAQQPQGIVSLGVYDDEPSAAEVFGLYVIPEARGTGVSWRLIEAAAALATQNGYAQLYYWVGSDNGRAIGFATNFGFLSSGYRRPSRASDLELGEEEVALVLSLEPDTTSVPNPTSGKAATREGPVS
jgi:GNAT superfamily N-acetyltransferase